MGDIKMIITGFSWLFASCTYKMGLNIQIEKGEERAAVCSQLVRRLLVLRVLLLCVHLNRCQWSLMNTSTTTPSLVLTELMTLFHLQIGECHT